MFSLNGVELDDDARGWVCRDETRPLTAIDIELVSLKATGRDEFIPDLPASATASPFPIMVETPKANLQTLRALFRSRPLVLTSSDALLADLELPVELVSMSPVGIGDADEVVELTALLRAPGLFWRDDTVDTSTAAAIGSASVVVDVMEDLSAPVRDALIRVKGNVTDLRVTDSGGSFFEYGVALTTADYLRFDSATGRAWVTDADTWTGGTEVTGDINTGPGVYPFELTPFWSSDPDTRVARITVTTDTRSSSPTIEVRGRRAYEV